MEDIIQLMNSDQELLQIEVVDFFNPQSHANYKTIPTRNSTDYEVKLLGINILDNQLLSKLKNIVFLDLTKLRIEVYPDLSNLKHLVEFHHSGGKFNLPDSICECKTLTKVIIGYVSFSKLPKNFSNLTNLEVLFIESANFKQLPKQVTKLLKLKYLEFTKNKIEKIPEDISNLEELRTLKLSQNKISELPKSLYNLKNLVTLDLSLNPIFNLDVSNVNWENLKKLNLSGTPFCRLKNDIETLKKKLPNCEIIV
jgi:Leucine-rich repeat (LRR) protein